MNTAPAMEYTEGRYQEWMRLANTYEHAGRYSQARIFFEKAFQEKPEASLPLARRSGVVQREMRQQGWNGEMLHPEEQLPRQQQMRRYKECVQRTPEQLSAHVLLGIYLKENDQLNDAREQLRQAITLQPKNVPSLIVMANIDSMDGQWDRALHWYRLALVQEPDNGIIHYNLAMIYFLSDMGNETRMACQRALSCLGDHQLRGWVEEMLKMLGKK